MIYLTSCVNWGEKRSGNGDNTLYLLRTLRRLKKAKKGGKKTYHSTFLSTFRRLSTSDNGRKVSGNIYSGLDRK